MTDADRQRLRFQLELEFVQCLSNPNYLHFLAQQGYFQDAAFQRYLHYLQYWKQPKYARFLLFPQSLYFLERLQQDPEFCTELAKPAFPQFLHQQQFYQWRFPPK